MLVALPLTERKYPLPPSDRHPAKRLPWRILARGFLLLVDDGGDRGAELEIAERARGFRQLLQLALDEAGVDGVGAHLRVRDERRQKRDVGDDAANVGLFQPAVEL